VAPLPNAFSSPPNRSDRPAYTGSIEPIYIVPRSRPTLLFIGRLQARKRLDVLDPGLRPAACPKTYIRN